jgi:hypothetical protein
MMQTSIMVNRSFTEDDPIWDLVGMIESGITDG